MPIEQFAPELENIISLSEPIQMLADGFGGPQGQPKDRCGGRKAAICCSATFITTGACNTRLAKVCPWSRADQPGQWADSRPPGPSGRLRA